MHTFASVLAFGLAVQQATATFDWLKAPSFKCPANTNNVCNTYQKGGFNWGDLSLGSMSSFGDFNFQGFSCEKSFSKSSFVPKNFNQKCITGGLTSKPSCSHSKGFSITEMQITVEFEVDVDFIYKMGDGSICKHTESCSKHGSTVKNTQCGGATEVTFQLGSSHKGGDCAIGVHSVGFDCSPPSSTVPLISYTTTPIVKTTTPVAVTTTTPAVQTTTTTTISTTTPVVQTTVPTTTLISSTTAPVTTPSPVSTSTTTPLVLSSTVAPGSISVPYGNASVTASVVYQTTEITVIGCASTVTNCPASSTIVITSTVPVTTASPTTIATVPVSSTAAPVSQSSASPSSESTPVVVSTTPAPVTTYVPTTQEVVTTAVITQFTTICPVTATVTSGSSTYIQTSSSISTVTVTTISTICTKCVAPTPTPESVSSTAAPAVPTTLATVSTAPVSAPSPVPSAPCPDLVPSCLNTFLFETGCASNADSACYCPQKSFTVNVIDCITHHGKTPEEIASGIAYFAGICASAIPSNPAIITAIPSTVTLPPAVVATTAPPAPPAAAGPNTITAAPVAAPAPVTVVTVSVTTAVPCTFTAGPSAGATIPASSSISTIYTVVTVPQVGFTTAPATPVTPGVTAAPAPAPSVGLIPGTPAEVTSQAAPGFASSSYSLVQPSASMTINPASPTNIQIFPGAAPKGLKIELGAVVAGGLIALVMAL